MPAPSNKHGAVPNGCDVRSLIPSIMLTLACLVAPALFGVGDRAVAGVITLEKASEFGVEPMAGMPAGGIAPVWDLFGRINDRFFEFTISPTESQSDDDVRQGRGLLGFLAKSLCVVGRPSTSCAGGTRSIKQENDAVSGAILSHSTPPVMAQQNHRRIHLSDKLAPNPVMNDLSQPPRW